MHKLLVHSEYIYFDTQYTRLLTVNLKFPLQFTIVILFKDLWIPQLTKNET